jgi:acetyl esterase/lipase
MPHANMGNWRSKITGEPIDANYQAPRSVADLVSRRAKGSQIFEKLNVDLPELGDVHHGVVMRGQANSTPVAEIYVPKGAGPFPVLLHIHGGGWFAGSAAGERKFAMTVAAAGFVVVNIDYALAPEHPFPRGLEDCVYAARWIVSNIARYKGDPSRLAIGGCSAGGNLTMCTVLALHGSDVGLDGGDLAHIKVKFSGAIPQWGVLDVHRWIAEPHYYAGTSEIYIQSYLGPNFTGRIRDALVSPIENPHLDKMCPTYLCCGAEDAFLSHTLAMANALTLRDVPTTVSVVEGADHEFLKIPDKVPDGRDEIKRITTWMHRHLG